MNCWLLRHKGLVQNKKIPEEHRKKDISIYRKKEKHGKKEKKRTKWREKEKITWIGEQNTQ